MKNQLKIFLFVCFVIFTGLLHSCAMDKDKEKVVIEPSASDSDAWTAKESEDTSLQGTYIYVFITGFIKNPGVYELPEGARLYELVELAGGFTEQAAQDYLNLAAYVKDGDKITVYSEEELAEAGGSITGSSEEGSGGRCININTADKEMLMTLPGIGEAKADAIIKYREENGTFSSIEDIMNISGIKQGAFDKIKDLITI